MDGQHTCVLVRTENTHARTQALSHTYRRTRTHKDTHRHTHTHIYIHRHTPMHTYLYKDRHTRAHTHVCFSGLRWQCEDLLASPLGKDKYVSGPKKTACSLNVKRWSVLVSLRVSHQQNTHMHACGNVGLGRCVSSIYGCVCAHIR